VGKNDQTNIEPPNKCSHCGNHVAKESFLQKNSVVGLDRFFNMCAPCRVKLSARKTAWKDKKHQTNDSPPNKRKLLAERDIMCTQKGLEQVQPSFNPLNTLRVY
jgi:hypothetical protein